jgi:hypothetical protein
MVARSVACVMGVCLCSRPRCYSVPAIVSGDEERVCEWDVSLCCDNLSEMKLLSYFARI